MIEIQKISKIYKTRNGIVTALSNISIDIETSKIVAIIGKSGSGKSTLLQIIGGMETVTSGKILIDGLNIIDLNNNKLSQFRSQNIGFVFQNFYLQNYLNVFHNVALPLIGSKNSRFEKSFKVMAALKMVGLEDKIYSKISQLSGGQQQRVAIARGIIKQPKILLMDEPTGNLDGQTKNSIMKLVQTLNKDYKMTVVIVTHDKSISSICDKVIKLENGNIINPN